MTWIRRYKQEKLISKISVDFNFTFFSYAWLCVFRCSHRLLCWIKSCVQNFLWNCSHFILKWFQPNSFGELCFLEESCRNMPKKKIKFWQFWERPLFNISEYTFKFQMDSVNFLRANTEIIPMISILLIESLKGEQYPKPKFSMFCALFQNNKHF